MNELQTLQHEEERATRRIQELEKIVADDTTGIVQRSKAKVELAELQHYNYGKGTTDHGGIVPLDSDGLVAKNKARVESDILRNEKRLEREAEIKQIQRELKNEAVVKSAERRKQLEEQLNAAQEAIEALDIEDAVAELDCTNYLNTQGTVMTVRPSCMTGSSDSSAIDSNSPRSKASRLREERLKEQVSMLRQDAGERALTIENLNRMLEEQEKENKKRIEALNSHVGVLVSEANDREKLVNHWKDKAKRLSVRCISLEEDAAKREKRIQELQDWNKIQEERIKSLSNKPEQRSNAPPPSTLKTLPRPSLLPAKSRRFSTRASLDPSFNATLRRASQAGSVNEQVREVAKVELMALEERLAMMDTEKTELMQELEVMKAVLALPSDDDKKKKKKKRERLVYQLSCRKCNKHMNFVGTTEKDLKTTMMRHFDRVYVATKKSKSKKVAATGEEKESSTTPEAWSEDFAQHFAKHCKSRIKSVSKDDVVNFCIDNVKVEVLKRSDGAELYWEDTED